jgi:site-specific DNA-methyltransferase (adenine-specific)
MDCVVGMKLLNDESIDLTVTSPPYDNMRTYKGFNFDFENVAKELYRVTKKGGVVVWVVGDQTINGSETGTSFKQALYFMELGFNLHDTMIYMKPSASFPEYNRYYQIFEYMFVFSKDKPKTVNLIQDKENKWAGYSSWACATQRRDDGSLQKQKIINVKEKGIRYNVWTIFNGKGYSVKDKIAYEHPAIFPEQLANDHILSWSNENDLILDPFMGSGTTAKMARLNNRNFIGFEISKEYCEIANKRIKPYLDQINIFDLEANI